jgi:hypothetical protein
MIFGTKITTRCKQCKKEVKVTEIYIAESGAINLYYSCGHSNHDYELKQRTEK